MQKRERGREGGGSRIKRLGMLTAPPPTQGAMGVVVCHREGGNASQRKIDFCHIHKTTLP